MDADQVAALRVLLAPTGWIERTRAFARVLRTSTRSPGGLLLVGTPDEEPWHLAAHLDEESRFAGLPELTPTLVRWAPAPDAPAHLRVGLERLEAARRGEALFVVSPAAAPVPLLERVSDARRAGAVILAMDQGDEQLEELAHEALTVRAAAGPVTFDVAQHLVSAAAGEPHGRAGPPAGLRGLRSRLARLLDTVSGPPPE
ncbi:MAG TPA: hypothetical protein VGS62_00610 [Streptosporangiaceae bacterium]|nr:hypothetical protein [Streptosporangiaceae bacterium]